MKKIYLLLIFIGVIVNAQIDTVQVLKRFEVFKNNECHQLYAIREYESELYDYTTYLKSYGAQIDSSYSSEAYTAWTYLINDRCKKGSKVSFVEYFPYVFRYDVNYRERQTLYSLRNSNKLQNKFSLKYADIKNDEKFFRMLYFKLYETTSEDRFSYELEKRYWLLNNSNVTQEDFQDFDKWFEQDNLNKNDEPKLKLPKEDMEGYNYIPLVTKQENFALTRDYQRDSDFYYKKDKTFTKKPIWTVKHENSVNSLQMREDYCVRILYLYKIEMAEALGESNYNEIAQSMADTYYAKYIQLIDQGRCQGTEEEQNKLKKYIK